MASESYEQLRVRCEKELRETGKIDHGLRETKRQAFQAEWKAKLAENRNGLAAAQEVYLSRFSEQEQPKVRERLAAANKSARA